MDESAFGRVRLLLVVVQRSGSQVVGHAAPGLAGHPHGPGPRPGPRAAHAGRAGHREQPQGPDEPSAGPGAAHEGRRCASPPSHTKHPPRATVPPGVLCVDPTARRNHVRALRMAAPSTQSGQSFAIARLQQRIVFFLAQHRSLPDRAFDPVCLLSTLSVVGCRTIVSH